MKSKLSLVGNTTVLNNRAWNVIGIGARSQDADAYIARIAARDTPYFLDINTIRLRIDGSVYPTGQLGAFFSRTLLHPKINLNADKIVLDYGTGSGFLAVFAAKQGATVVAVDKNPAAIECAKYNAQENNVAKQIDFRISDSLSAIGEQEKFDLVLAGIPWENAQAETPLEMAFYDPGFIMKRSLAEQSKNLLKPGGSMLFTYSKRVEEKDPIANFFPDYKVKILAEEILHDEPHYIIRVKPN